MKKLVFKYYRSSLTEAQANVKWTYEGQVKSIDDINSEVMAEFFEKKGITDMETLRSIVKENRSFAEKFVDWLNRIIQLPKRVWQHVNFLLGSRKSRKHGKNLLTAGKLRSYLWTIRRVWELPRRSGAKAYTKA